jgi:beta-lactamase superfamily II metal-dependent hydrolase
LIELWLLRLADPRLGDAKGANAKQYQRLRREAEREARQCATELMKLTRANDDAQLLSTRTQVQRYVEWWSDPEFEGAMADLGGMRSTGVRSWKKLGIVKLAQDIVGILELRGRAKRLADGAAPCAPAAAPPAPVPAAPPSPAAKPAPASTIVAAMAAHEKAVAARGDNGAAIAAAQTDARPDQVATAATAFLAATPGAARAASSSHSAVLRIEMLPVGHGDCLWIEYGDGPKVARVLVDCGSANTYPNTLRKRIQAQDKSERAFELFILTHIDDDHIGGGIPFLKEAAGLGVAFGDVWFNGWKHLRPYGHLNAKQGEIFSELTRKNGFAWNTWRDGGAIVLPEDGSLPTCKLPGGLVLTLLSPTVEKLKDLAPKWQKEVEALGKKPGEGGWLGEVARGTGSTDVATLANSTFDPDAAENNGSSIAVLAEYAGKSVLLGADAHAPVLVASIRRLLAARKQDKLRLDAFKLPHHGSRSNLNKELLALLDCHNYLVSTNGSTFRHPDGEAIGRVIQFGGARPRLLFNYESAFSGIWKPDELQHRYNYEAIYPGDAKKPGLIVPL